MFIGPRTTVGKDSASLEKDGGDWDHFEDDYDEERCLLQPFKDKDEGHIASVWFLYFFSIF